MASLDQLIELLNRGTPFSSSELCRRQLHIPAVEAFIYDFQGRVYLESCRFDRIGEKGRRPSISMALVDAEQCFWLQYVARRQRSNFGHPSEPERMINFGMPLAELPLTTRKLGQQCLSILGGCV